MLVGFHSVAIIEPPNPIDDRRARTEIHGPQKRPYRIVARLRSDEPHSCRLHVADSRGAGHGANARRRRVPCDAGDDAAGATTTLRIATAAGDDAVRRVGNTTGVGLIHAHQGLPLRFLRHSGRRRTLPAARVPAAAGRSLHRRSRNAAGLRFRLGLGTRHQVRGSRCGCAGPRSRRPAPLTGGQPAADSVTPNRWIE